MYQEFDFVRQDLLSRIDGGGRSSLSIKIRTFLTMFGYTANQRVRQSSLDAVLEILARWGIGYRFPRGQRADDYITLFRQSDSAPPEPPRDDHADSVETAPHVLPPLEDPLSFVFVVDDQVDRERSAARAHDIIAAVWRAEPVCLFVDAPDEFFTLAAGILAAVMRRRALMYRNPHQSFTLPLAPEVLSTGGLRSLQGLSGDQSAWPDIPRRGAVYLIRDEPNDVQDDELAAFVREALVPHTHRLHARFVSTVAVHGLAGGTARDDGRFDEVIEWLAALAGGPSLASGLVPEEHAEIQLASLVADAQQIREAALAREALEATDAAFSAAFESSEHMLLKGAALRYLRERYGAEVEVEKTVDAYEAVEADDDFDMPEQRQIRPDLRVGSKLFVEIETLRGIAILGSDPFVILENKLRRKLEGLRSAGEVWLLVPADVAMLGRCQLSALVRNLDGERIRLGFWDAQRHEPVLLEPVDPPQEAPRLRGVSWRVRKVATAAPRTTWDDVAGYGDLREMLQRDVVEPLVHAERYRGLGLEPPGGVLLYGLPGCGKSLIGKILADTNELASRRLVPSDFTSRWLGEGVEKIREVFDWARRRAPSVLVIDEIDGIAPERREHNMHSDEKRQVNELLAQLDRTVDNGVLVVATTNYIRGVDPAVRRAGRFDFKVPVFPPTLADRQAILRHYLGKVAPLTFGAIDDAAVQQLAAWMTLYVPADIRHVVTTAARRAVARTQGQPILSYADLEEAARTHLRSVRADEATEWLDQAQLELGDDPRVKLLRHEIETAYSLETAFQR